MTTPVNPTHEQTPTPAPGCDTCGGWERERRRAEASGDHSRAIDCRIELSRHKLRDHSDDGTSA